jgi:hypothetical protein
MRAVEKPIATRAIPRDRSSFWACCGYMHFSHSTLRQLLISPALFLCRKGERRLVDTSPQYRLQVKGEFEQLQLLLIQTDVKKIKALTAQR